MIPPLFNDKQLGTTFVIILLLEIDALYEEKRSIVSHFKAQEKEFREYREGMRLKQKHVEYLQREEKRLAYEQELWVFIMGFIGRTINLWTGAVKNSVYWNKYFA